MSLAVTQGYIKCDACGCDGACGVEDGDYDPAPQAVRAWLDRQHCKPGGLSPEARAVVEQLIDDLEAGGF